RGVVLRHAEHPWWARAWSRGPRCPLSEAMLPRGRLFQLYPRCLRHRSWARGRASGRSPVRVSGRPTTCRSQCSLTETVVAVSAPATPWCHRGKVLWLRPRSPLRDRSSGWPRRGHRRLRCAFVPLVGVKTRGTGARCVSVGSVHGERIHDRTDRLAQRPLRRPSRRQGRWRDEVGHLVKTVQHVTRTNSKLRVPYDHAKYGICDVLLPWATPVGFCRHVAVDHRRPSVESASALLRRSFPLD